MATELILPVNIYFIFDIDHNYLFIYDEHNKIYQRQHALESVSKSIHS